MALQRLMGPKECTSVLHYIQKDVYTVCTNGPKLECTTMNAKRKFAISLLTFLTYCTFYRNVLCITYAQRCRSALAPCGTFIHIHISEGR